MFHDSRNKSGASATSQSHLQCNLRLKLGGRHLLLGKNGCGKTTLLRAVRDGRLAIPTGVGTFLVDQELALLDPEKTVLGSVLSADTSRCFLQKRCQELEARMEARCSEHDEEAASLELCSLYEALAGDEEAARERRARGILTGLGFSGSQVEAPVADLSGGWKMRAALAVALFVDPQLLMLDEPTNHLDMQAILWLQKYLVEHYSGGSRTLLCVSHDRSFVNAVLTEIIVLEDRSLTNFVGSLEDFEAAAEQLAKHMEREGAVLQQKRAAAAQAIKNHQAREARSMKNRASNKEHTRYAPYQECFSGSAQSSKITALQGKLERVGLEKTADGKRYKKSEHGFRLGSVVDNEGESSGRALAAAPLFKRSDPTVKFHFGDVSYLGVAEDMPILQLQAAGFCYPGRSTPALAAVDLSVSAKSRIALAGANGAGKTTLLKLIAGVFEASSGEIRHHRNLKIGHLSQEESDRLQTLPSTAVAYLQECFPSKSALELRALLGSFGIKGSLATQELSSLSGGQRVRVAFAKICAEKPQLLVLDEPTNHLDLYSIDALTEALRDFPGAVILATHDRSMLQALCGHVLVVRGGSCEALRARDEASPSSWLLRATLQDDMACEGDSGGCKAAQRSCALRGPARLRRPVRAQEGEPSKPEAKTSACPSATAEVQHAAEELQQLQETKAPLRGAEKEFLQSVKRLREILKLEALGVSGQLQKTQEAKLQRKGEVLKELAEVVAYLPHDSDLGDRNADVLAMLPSVA